MNPQEEPRPRQAQRVLGAADTVGRLVSSAPPDEGAVAAQAGEELTDRILTGDLAPGARIPSERELARRLGVGRAAVRAVLSRLERRGLIVREHGRGTFAARPRLVHSTTQLRSFFEQLAAQDQVPVSRILSASEAWATRAVARLLDIRPGEPVYRLVRLRFANGSAVALSTSLFPARTLPGILELDLEHASLYRLMDEHYRTRPVRAIQSVEPVNATPYEAGLLGVRAGTALLLAERTSWDALGRVLEHSRDLHRGDRARFEGELRP